MLGIMEEQMLEHLQSNRRFPGAFFAKHDGSGWIYGVSIYFFPCRVKRLAQAIFLEHLVGLRVFRDNGLARAASWQTIWSGEKAGKSGNGRAIAFLTLIVRDRKTEQS